MDLSLQHQKLLIEASLQYAPPQRQTVSRRWESADRYYEIRVEPDLFNDQVLTAINGGRGSRLGRIRVVAVDDNVVPMLNSIEKRRLARSYLEVSPIAHAKSL